VPKAVDRTQSSDNDFCSKEFTHGVSRMGVGSKIAILLNGPPRAGKDTAVAVLE